MGGISPWFLNKNFLLTVKSIDKPTEGVKEKKQGRIRDLRGFGLIRWGVGGRIE